MEKSNDRIPRGEMALARKMAAVGLKNARFIKSDPAKKRVTIARDVLSWLAMGKLQAQAGYYVTVTPEVVDVVNGYNCQACALGGLFACAVERGDAGGTLRESEGQHTVFVKDHYEYVADTFEGANLYHKMEGIFDTVQLATIEAAFEGERGLPTTSRKAGGSTQDLNGHWDDPDHMTKAFESYARYQWDDGERMAAIMRNIIRNKGTFVPEDL